MGCVEDQLDGTDVQEGVYPEELEEDGHYQKPVFEEAPAEGRKLPGSEGPDVEELAGHSAQERHRHRLFVEKGV